MKRKIFISQPMSDLPVKELLKERNRAIEKCKEIFGPDNIEIIDSLFKFPKGTSALWSLAKSIEALSEANTVYFVKRWKDYRGCRIEHQCAVEYGLEIFEE